MFVQTCELHPGLAAEAGLALPKPSPFGIGETGFAARRAAAAAGSEHPCDADLFAYSHTWRTGDLMLRDNRWTMHRGRPHDENQPRDLRRATTLASGSTLQEMV
jgi:hypothetical protein